MDENDRSSRSLSRLFSPLGKSATYFARHGLRGGLLRAWSRLAEAGRAGGVTGIINSLRDRFQRLDRRLDSSWLDKPCLDDILRSAPGDGPTGRAARALTEARVARPALIVDHAGGGGTNAYTASRVAGILAAGDAAVVVADDVLLELLRVTIYTPADPNSPHRLTARDLTELARLVGTLRPCLVVVNNLVCWREPLAVLSFLAGLRRGGDDLRLEVLFHDFFACCPSYNLLDPVGRFCGLDERPGRCGSCLERNPFTPPRTPTDLVRWRAAWSGLIEAADSLLFFSEAARDLTARMFPEVTRRGTVRPLPPLGEFNVRHTIDPAWPTTVAVVGSISRAKGAGMVEELAPALAHRDPAARIVVIGEIDSALRPTNLLVTGPYERRDLPALLAEHRVTVAVIPSVCPETFCYVAQELMMLDVPVACLNLGAQAEFIRPYARGRVAEGTDAQVLLAAILELEMARRGGKVETICGIDRVSCLGSRPKR